MFSCRVVVGIENHGEPWSLLIGLNGLVCPIPLQILKDYTSGILRLSSVVHTEVFKNRKRQRPGLDQGTRSKAGAQKLQILALHDLVQLLLRRSCGDLVEILSKRFLH